MIGSVDRSQQRGPEAAQLPLPPDSGSAIPGRGAAWTTKPKSEEKMASSSSRGTAGGASTVGRRSGQGMISAKTKPMLGVCPASRNEATSKTLLHAYMIGGQQGAVNPTPQGTKAGPRTTYSRCLQAEAQERFACVSRPLADQPFGTSSTAYGGRRREADAFYAALQAQKVADPTRGKMQRQALGRPDLEKAVLLLRHPNGQGKIRPSRLPPQGAFARAQPQLETSEQL